MALEIDSAEKLISELPATHTLPLWAQMAKLNPAAPNPKCVPHVWKFSEVEPYLLRAGNLVTEKQAERRVLMLVNPAREAPYTTDTVYAGLQLVMPNETAPAHRHVAFAMRFIISGKGGFTAVHGSRIPMERGDVILTPTWNWHDHGKDGDGPMIWLDGLDLPLFRHFPVHFVQHFEKDRYPATNIDKEDSPIVYPWKQMQAELDAAADGGVSWVTKPYLKPDGRQVSLTLGGSAARLEAGSKSPAIRETASSVYHVVTGSGHSMIDGKQFSWKQGDTFCIPTWNSYQHFANDSGTVYLYRFDDKPMLQALGFYRVEGTDVEEYVST
ncbi:RmlC-like cupin domain-containing protein [Elsinoe ampelina]|uniref:RmlC-like cupin domain-containing protein n=1 Tax=Elsinoe ampelina TaxID=302913 RepID=A0A6A6G245_9PEZI|nr:RmlC-like cupin domain-containing protein [Elsinoe ampelina]